MVNYMQEQLIVILTTTLSLLTAWSWNSVLQQYIDEYYGRNIGTTLIFAVIVTIVTFLLVNWLLKHIVREEKLKNVKNIDLTEYVRNGIKIDQK